jgi:hypothetical protein
MSLKEGFAGNEVGVGLLAQRLPQPYGLHWIEVAGSGFGFRWCSLALADHHRCLETLEIAACMKVKKHRAAFLITPTVFGFLHHYALFLPVLFA